MILEFLKLITIMMLIAGLNLHFKEEANRKHFKNLYREMVEKARLESDSLVNQHFSSYAKGR